MAKRLEELEKEFILNEDMEYEDLRDLISRILKFCKVDNKGFVVMYQPSLRMVDKILLVLSARHLANKLQQKLGRKTTISEEVSAKELSNMLRKKDAVIIARLKDLKDAGKILSTKRGVYKIAPHVIEPFLKELEGGKNG